MPAWPASLPQQPELRSVRLTAPTNAVSRRQMDVGPPKSRRRSTASIRPLSCTFTPLTEAQAVTFQEFFEDDLAAGTLSFTMDHPITDAQITVKFTDAGYNLTTRGRDAYAVAVRLEILP